MSVIDEIEEYIVEWERENPGYFGKVIFEVNYKAGKAVVLNIDTRKSIKLD
jgi:hypothetical protein